MAIVVILNVADVMVKTGRYFSPLIISLHFLLLSFHVLIIMEILAGNKKNVPRKHE